LESEAPAKEGGVSVSADSRQSTVRELPNRCRCVYSEGAASWAGCPIHDEATSPAAKAVRDLYEQGRVAALEAAVKRYSDALDFLTGGIDREPWIAVYRSAGGGYEGLQAVARAALEWEGTDRGQWP
jgi:hypothetical protein